MKDYRKTSANVVITYYSRRVHLNQIMHLNTYCLSSGVGGLRWQKMAAAHKTTCRLFPRFGWSRGVSPNQGEAGGATGLGVNLFVMYRRVAHKPCALDLATCAAFACWKTCAHKSHHQCFIMQLVLRAQGAVRVWALYII